MSGTATLSWINNPPSATDPLTIISSVSPFFYVVADLGITIGTGVSAWADQSGNNRNFSQATGGAQPTYNAADSNFGGRASMYADGTDDTMTISGWNPPAPGTTNIWFLSVFRQRGTWVNGDYICSAGSSTLGLQQQGTSPQLRLLNPTGTTQNGGAALNQATRVEWLFSNSTADYIKAGSTTTTGVNAGNSDPTGFILFSRGAAQFGELDMAMIGAWAGQPTSGELASLDAWVSTYYGPGIAV